MIHNKIRLFIRLILNNIYKILGQNITGDITKVIFPSCKLFFLANKNHLKVKIPSNFEI